MATKSANRRRRQTAKKLKPALSATGITARKKLELAVKDVNKKLSTLVALHYFAA
jgi:hypothetical protein